MKATQHTTSWLKQHPLIFNLLMIALLILAMAIVAHFTMQVATRHFSRRTVPDLSGVGLSEAQEIARKNDLRLHINDSLFVPIYEGGIILQQLPESGVEVKPGRTIYITINSFREKMVPIPYVAGRSLRQAKNMLEIAGLGIDRLIYREDIATNYVLEEYFERRPIEAETRMEAEIGSGITLHVGVEQGSERTVVPLLVGLTLREAKSRLWEAGLNVGKIHQDEGINLLNQKDAHVYVQTPLARNYINLGEEVSLRMTLDNEKAKTEAMKASEEAQKLMEEQRLEQEKADSLAALNSFEAALEGISTDSLSTTSTPSTSEQQTTQTNDDEFFF